MGSLVREVHFRSHICLKAISVTRMLHKILCFVLINAAFIQSQAVIKRSEDSNDVDVPSSQPELDTNDLPGNGTDDEPALADQTTDVPSGDGTDSEPALEDQATTDIPEEATDSETTPADETTTDLPASSTDTTTEGLLSEAGKHVVENAVVPGVDSVVNRMFDAVGHQIDRIDPTTVSPSKKSTTEKHTKHTSATNPTTSSTPKPTKHKTTTRSTTKPTKPKTTTSHKTTKTTKTRKTRRPKHNRRTIMHA